MTTAHSWIHPICNAIVSWQESGENPVVFCYLIVWGFFLGSPKLSSITARLEPACWNRSSTSSARSITRMGSGN